MKRKEIKTNKGKYSATLYNIGLDVDIFYDGELIAQAKNTGITSESLLSGFLAKIIEKLEDD